MPSSVVDPRNTVMNKTNRICRHGIYILLGDTVNKEINRCTYKLISRSEKGLLKMRGREDIDGGKAI